MNQAIQDMLATPGTHYITDPGQLEPRTGPNGETLPPKQQCVPVWVNDQGKAFQLGKGNQLGAEIDPSVFREDSIVLRERPVYRKLA